MQCEVGRVELPAPLQAQLAVVWPQLQTAVGYRSVWLDAEERIWLSEPDDELEVHGFRLVGTFHRPSEQTLAIALLRQGSRSEPAVVRSTSLELCWA